MRFSGSFAFWNSPRRSQPRCAWGDGQMGAWRAQTRLWQWITRARGGSGLAPCLACEFSPTANIADTFLQPVSPGIKADNIYAVFHLFAQRFQGFGFQVPGSGSVDSRLPLKSLQTVTRFQVPVPSPSWWNKFDRGTISVLVTIVGLPAAPRCVRILHKDAMETL